MNAIFNKATWEKYLKGYTIYDCAIFREHGFCLAMVEDKGDREILPRTRFLSVIYDKPIVVGSLPMAEFGDFTFSSICRGTNPREYVGVDTNSQVYSVGAQRNIEEKAIDRLIDMTTHQGEVGVIAKVVRAADQVFALGNYRKIYRRIGFEDWIELGMEGKGAPVPADIDTNKNYSTDLGFRDVSAFSPDDLYAVGGKGDAWRFDGKTWHDCALPSNAGLSTVCCAGDGKVYISEMNGTVWAGRGDQWRRVASADLAFGFQPVDSAWFDERLYLGGQQGLWIIDQKRQTLLPLHEAESGAPNPTNSGRLDVSPDGKYLLTAGPHGVCIHDGMQWKRLFNALDFE